MIIPVILSGGSGTRLWPLSRKLHPKQFIELMGKTTLFQEAVLRLPESIENPLIICNEEHRFLAAEQLRKINKEPKNIILEPVGRNTAPAIALAALKSIKESEDAILLVLSADHLIQDMDKFHQAIALATKQAEQNKLVTFGIAPNKIETGYGYIKANISKNKNYYDIDEFVEKPDYKTAKKYVDSGGYFWNSGMFMFKASVYLSELEKYEPEILSACQKSCQTEFYDLDFIRLNEQEFLKCPSQSIDYAVMEKTKNASMVILDANWNDVGSWTALWDSQVKDNDDNLVVGDVILDKVSDTYVHSTSNRLVSVIGLSDLIVVDTQDAVLVTNKEHAQDVKNIVEKIKKSGRLESDQHRKIFRPWGYYDSIDRGEGFQVKRILVNPGQKLSLQKHNHRSEHWVVVKGKAQVTCGEKTFQLIENQSTYISLGKVHRLENIEDTPLEIIEIQTGSYLGEDDIIRIDDDYERA
ncbi:mannose-1-phosphate guanyltransferase [Candidatus Thioglobus autotrophicus]|uniref:mannose-1-phosphate guanylyltransferase n=1 Tax=Candidatus Thioglobus autotrophicus TaxID=1705394 RepID=A0A0M4PMI9_9GAMM|nr:mannose-1-phosphate guanylyltransferase/mannose-6-phosphate isomerase [Candidatus Thioglobus autotrophicus]ALE52204.1 mannose-1-phosphate guanyltransferase [Candidatus Thioglobus autotrophicus]